MNRHSFQLRATIDFLKRFFSRGQSLFALVILAGYLFVAIAAPALAPSEGRTAIGRPPPRPPSPDAPLGTVNGRDIFYSIVWGTRQALRFGLLITVMTASFGILVGAISGYYGGILNRVVMRITDGFLAFPVIAGVILFRTYWGRFLMDLPPLVAEVLMTLEIGPTAIALILFSWMAYARTINTSVNQLKQEEYVLAARMLGATNRRIILRHLLPNGIAPVVVLATRDIGGMVTMAATFAFIGIGGGSAWGSLLAEGRDWIIGFGGNLFAHWWVFLPATLALMVFSIAWKMLGDSLSIALNPQVYKRQN